MANCFIVLNGTTIYPELPVGRSRIFVREQRRMVNGQMRTAHRARKMSFTLTLRDATEAERTAWLAAADETQSLTFADELGVSRTVVVQEVTEDLTRTAPTVEGGLSTTGPAFYDLTVVVEEV